MMVYFQQIREYIKRFTLIVGIVVCGLFVLSQSKVVLAAPISTTVDTQADWIKGKYEFNSIDASTSAGLIQLQKDNGSWDASGPANINHNIASYTKMIKIGSFLYIFRHGGNGQFLRYDMETTEWKEMAFLPIEPNGIVDATTNGTDTIWAFATLGGRKHFLKYDVPTNTWSFLADTPNTLNTKASLEYVPGAINYIYAIRGTGTYEFWKYAINGPSANTWSNINTNNSGYCQTYCDLVYDGSRYIYLATDWQNPDYFMRYDTQSGGVWVVRGRPPLDGSFSTALDLLRVGDDYYTLRGAATRTFYKYTYATNTWSQIADSPFPTSYSALAYDSDNNRIAVYMDIGGLLYYYPATNTWSQPLQGPPGNGANLGQSVTTDGTDIYFCRGQGTNVCYKFIVATNTWTALPVMPAAVWYSAIVYNGGYLYVTNGNGNNFYRLNVGTGVWASLTAPPAAFQEGSSLVASDSSSLFGLRGAGGNQLYKWDGAIWTTKTAFPDVVYRGSGMIKAGAFLYALGGYNRGRFYKYDETNGALGAWSELASIPVGVYAGGDLIYNGGDYMYAQVGGENDMWGRQMYRYSISQNKWDRMADTPQMMRNSSGMVYLNNSIYSYQGYGFGMYRYTPPTGTRTYTKYNNTNSVISGYWYSPVYDLKGIQTWSSFSKSDSTPGTTQVNYYSRSSDNQNVWDSWVLVTGGNVQSQPRRYTQFKVELDGAGDGSETPSIDSFTFAYNPDDTGPDMSSFAVQGFVATGGAQITSGNSYPGVHPYFQWNGASETLSSLDGYYVYFGTNALATPSTDGTYQTVANYTVTAGMAYGQTYYLRIQAKDSSSNISEIIPGFVYTYTGISPTTTTTITTQADWDNVEASKSGIYSGTAQWWNQSYSYRKQLTISPTTYVPLNSLAKLTIDTAALETAGKLRSDRKDLRIVYWDGNAWKEIERDYVDTTATYFILQKSINPTSPDSNYYVYYGNANETTQPKNTLGNYSAGSKWGGALSFDGGDYVRIPSMINNQSKLTIEGWFKYNNTSNAYRYVYGDASSQVAVGVYYNQNNLTYSFKTSGTTFSNVQGTIQLVPGSWNHFAITYDSTTGDYKSYVNGILDYTRTAVTGNVSVAAVQQYIGYSGGYYFYGYLDEYRISNNVRYTAPFTPPVAKFTTDANTLALYHFDEDPGQVLTDSSGNSNNGIIGATAAVVETSDPSWVSGNTGLLYFDGTNDYIRVGAAQINNRPLVTIEGWFKPAEAGGNRWFYGDTSAAEQVAIGLNGTTNTMMYRYRTAPSSQYTGTGSITITPNTWNHFAVVYDATAGTYTAYINGQSDYSRASLAGNLVATNQQTIGGAGTGYFNGYLSEFRVSNIARYTTTFTPPTAPFTTGIYYAPDPNTLALYHFNDNNYQVLTDAMGAYAGSFGTGGGIDVSDPTWYVGGQIPITVNTEETAPVSPANNSLSLESMGTGSWAGYQFSSLPWGARMYYGSGIYANNKLYVLRGSNSPSFYQYDLNTLEWKQLSNTPIGTGGTNGTYYAAMAYDGGDYIYALRGNTTQDFYRYSISQNIWDMASMAQPTANFSAGATLVKGKDVNGVDVYYALQGGGALGFFLYYPGTNTWVSKTSPPAGTNAGAGMVYDATEGSIYITTGQSYNFYKYSIAEDVWNTTATAPPFAPYPMGFTNNNLISYGNYYYFFTSYDYQQNGDLRHIAWRYDKTNERWENVDNATEFFARTGATVYDGSRYVYLIQGDSAGSTGTTAVARYDLQTNKITPETPPLPMERTYEGNGTNLYHAVSTDTSLAFDGNDTVYFAQGGTNFVDKYQVSTKRWTRMADLPCLYYGGLVHTGSTLFAFCGNLTKTGFKYDEGSKNWTQIADTPDTIRSGGSQPAVYNGVDAIYVLRGVATQTIYKYTIATDTWTTEVSNTTPIIPNIANGNGVGASITYDGSDNLFVFQGNMTNLFYRYKISSPSGWVSLAPAPENVHMGSGSVYNNGKIYITSGSYNTAMYVYDVATNTWGMGQFASSAIYAGGALVKGPGNSMYATQGNGTYTFWKYNLPSSSTSYVYKGTYTSEPISLGNPFAFAGLSATVASPSATSFTFETRTSSDALTWDGWLASSAQKKNVADNVYSLLIGSQPKKYIQVRVTLESEESVSTPTISDISVEYYDDITAPTNPTALSSYTSATKSASLVTDVWYNKSAPYFEWTGASDGTGSGVNGYYVYFGQDVNADATVSGQLITTASYSASLATDGTADGEYFLKIKAVDNAGNINGTHWAPYNYFYDPTPPTMVASENVSVLPSGYTSTNNFTFHWIPTSDPLRNSTASGLMEYYYKTGTPSGELSNYQPFTGTCTSDICTLSGITAYQEGTNTFYLKADDIAGNFSAATNVNYNFNSVAPSPPRNVAVDTSQLASNKFSFTWDEPSIFRGTIKEYRYSVNELPNESNISTTAAKLVNNVRGTHDGVNTFYVVAVDEANNVAYGNYASKTFSVSVSAPGIPLAPESFDNSIRATKKYRIGLSWDPPTDKGSAFDRYEIYASTTDAECSTDMSTFTKVGSTAGNSYVVTSIGETDLESTTYYVCLTACASTNQCSGPSTTLSEMPTGRWLVAPELVASQSATVKTKSAIIGWSTSRASNSFIKFGKKSGDYTTEVGSSTQVSYHEITLLGLDPGTQYFYKALWADEDGNMGSTDEMTFTTNPAPFVSNVKFTRVNINSAQVTFTIKSAIKASVQYGKTISYGSVESISTSKSETTYTIEVDSLIEGTIYHLRIAGEDDEANIYYSDDYTFETLPTPKIIGLRLQQVIGMPTATLRLLWTTNTLASSVITYYPTKMPQQAVDNISLVLKKNHEVILKNLLDDTDYTLLIKGKDSSGNEAKTETRALKTANDVRPPEMQNLNVESTIIGVGEDARAQIVISWDTDEPSTTQIEYGQGTGTTYNQTTQEDSNKTSNHTVTITGLSPSKIYHLRALSKDKADNVGQSLDTVIITPKSTKDALNLVIDNLSKTFGFLKAFNNTK